MVNRNPPFYDKQQMNTFKKIIRGNVRYPKSCSPEVKSFIQCFLLLRPVRRLGMQHNAKELIEGKAFFSGFNWQQLRDRTMRAPIVNKIRSLEEISNLRCSSPRKHKRKIVAKTDDIEEVF